MTDRAKVRQRLTYFVKAAELTQKAATAPVLERYGLSYAQLSMLLSVVYTPGASSAALARMHGITAQSAGEVIGALVGRGLMERKAHPSHRRILTIELTQAGHAMVEEAQTMLDAIDARLTQGLSQKDLLIARQVLTTIIANGDIVLPGII